MDNFIVKELCRKGKVSAYCLIPDEGYALVRKSDSFKSENPISIPAYEDAQKITEDFYAEKTEDEKENEPQ